jgi:SNF2 family DNA or RNA helicase
MRTYGSIKLKGGDWVIEAEPHVVIRLKRLFAKLGKSAKKLEIKHSQDVARDLLWAMERYPLEVSDADLRYMRAQADLHIERTERFVKVLAGQSAPQEFQLALPPRDYQRIAADLALQSSGLLIADEVGVGKTVQAICMFTDPRTRPALVVTLTHLPKQWAGEIARFAPRLRTHILKKASPYPLPEVDVIITNYHKLSGWAPALAGKVNCIVFDEVQELRSAGTQRYVAATEIAAPATWRVGLSATPIHNYGNEFFNVLNVLRPSELGTKSEFVTEWCGESDARGNSKIKDPRAFGSYLREQGIMIRRTRADVGRELPGLSIVPHTVESGDIFDQLDADAITELAKFILNRDNNKGLEQMQARSDLDWQLRQATGLAKAKYVAEFVKMLLESGEERVLLYGWHHSVYEVWREALKDVGVAMFTGEESANQKEASKHAFVNGDARVLIMSLRAGAGLDGLQHCCRTVVFGELDWSPSVHEQATGRVFRDGQKDPVVAYYLTSDEGSDPVLQSALGVKRMQLEGVRNPTEFAAMETVKREGVVDLARAVLAKRKPVQTHLVAE